METLAVLETVRREAKTMGASSGGTGRSRTWTAGATPRGTTGPSAPGWRTERQFQLEDDGSFTGKNAGGFSWKMTAVSAGDAADAAAI